MNNKNNKHYIYNNDKYPMILIEIKIIVTLYKIHIIYYIYFLVIIMN